RAGRARDAGAGRRPSAGIPRDFAGEVPGGRLSELGGSRFVPQKAVPERLARAPKPIRSVRSRVPPPLPRPRALTQRDTQKGGNAESAEDLARPPAATKTITEKNENGRDRRDNRTSASSALSAFLNLFVSFVCFVDN